jgi:asparagine N-glycosylation enzyme membrane subunit Stt3
MMESNSEEEQREPEVHQDERVKEEVVKEEVVLETAINPVDSAKEVMEERKEKVLNYLKKDKKWVVWGIFIIIAWFGYFIRTRNLPLLRDLTTGKFIPMALDPYAFLRYARTIVDTGSLPAVDFMRYHPWGYNQLIEFKLLSFVIVYLHKILSIFGPSFTLEKAHVLYPPIAFIVGLIFFFLLVRKLTDYRVGLLASLLLTIIPPYINRTIAGFSDKEALGMTLFFAALYFFFVSWEHKKTVKVVLFGALAGLSTGLLTLVWGGFSFVVSIIAIFGFVNFVFLKMKRKQFWSYFSWYILFFLIMLVIRGSRLQDLVGTYFGAAAAFALLIGICNLLILKFDLKAKLEAKLKLPYQVQGLLLASIIGILISIFMFGSGFILEQIKQIFITLTTPFGNDRWQLTVAEARQPYLVESIGQIGWKFFWIYVAGAFVLVYDFLKNLRKRVRWTGFGIFVLFLLGFSFSRFSSGSNILNGTSFFSLNIMYFGSMLLLLISYVGYYFYNYYKDKEILERIKSLGNNYIFILIWLFVMLVASRSAVRLLFIFSIIITLLAAYLGVRLFDVSLKMKKDYYKIGIWILLFFLFASPFSIFGSFAFGLLDRGVIIDHSNRLLEQAKISGVSYNQQWQVAGAWTRDNTPKDAVFAHWWDYGYWVQTGFERATVTDGGNAKVSLNHFMGRHVLTGQNETEALEFLKAHNVTNLLMISDEIGKYPAFSSIGADKNWDRYSWFPILRMDERRTQETRDQVIYTYTGTVPIDWDFTYKGDVFIRGRTAIVGFFIPTRGVNGTLVIENPVGIVMKDGQQKQIPLECVFLEGREINFNQKGLGGCLQIIPNIQGNTGNPIGAALYVSEKVRRTLFAQLYLFSKPGKNLRLAYSDERGIPLSLFNGRIVGPLKIWEVSYPPGLEIPEKFLIDKLPDESVKSVEGRY